MVVCKATEFTEILSFSLYGLTALPWHRPPGQVCGKDVFYTLISPLSQITRAGERRPCWYNLAARRQVSARLLS